MWRRAGPAIAMAAAAFGAGAAGAQGKPDKATFRIAGAGFEMPLPAGYCLPTGKAVDGAQITAAGDRDNVTDLTLVSCTGEPFSSYILIKTPTTVLTLDINREQALKGLGEAFDAPDFKQKLASGELLRDSGKGVSDALGQRVDLVGEVKPLGKDEACAYVGGTADVKLTNSSHRVSVGSCISAVGRRFMAVNVYGPDKGAAGVVALLATARRVLETIRPLPDS